jgi:hypothetical protein
VGYRHKPKNIVLKFDEGSDYPGFECTLRGLTLGEYREVIGIDEVDNVAIGSMLDSFATALISWNLEDEQGHPVAPTPEAVLAQDKDLMLKAAESWIDAIHGVPAPLGQSSPDGAPSPEVSIPMDVLSPSLAS